MKNKRPLQPNTIRNRRARHDYELGDSFELGIVLNGRETKALRMGQGHLRGAYVTIKDGELWLINATIAGNNRLPIDESEQTQNRKLLAKRREIDRLIAAKQQGYTLVPTEILTKKRYIKIRVAIGRGKKHFDKRQALKERDAGRDMHRALKSH